MRQASTVREPRPGATVTGRSHRARAATFFMGATLVGAALTVWLVARSGWAGVSAVMLRGGVGLLWLIPLRVGLLACEVRGWGALLGIGRRVSWFVLSWLGLVRDAVNTFLPVARIGGELVAIRLLCLKGLNAATVSASIVVETSIALVLQILMTVSGIAVMLGHNAGQALLPDLLGGLGLAVVVVVIFVTIQIRVGLVSTVERVIGRFWRSRATSAGALFPGLDRKVVVLYRCPSALARCAAWQVFGFVAGAAELYVMAALMHIPLGLGQIFVLESLIQAVHSVSFVVPGALGVQEAGFVGLGLVLGIPADSALALALTRRLRQVAIGLPVLASWQWYEWRARRLSSEAAVPASS